MVRGIPVSISREELERMVREKKSNQYIAERFDCGTTTIARKIRKSGLLGLRGNKEVSFEDVEERDFIYLAGIIDGEGTITINGWKWRTCAGVPRMEVTNTDERLTDWLEGTFGGHITPDDNGNPNHKRRYIWYLNGKQTVILCQILIPYLKIKKEQAVLVAEFYTKRRLRERREDGTWKRLTEEERQRRQVIAEQIFELNKKGRRLT